MTVIGRTRRTFGILLLGGAGLALACDGGTTTPVDDLEITPTTVTLVPGEARQMVATGGPGGAVSWTSSRPEVATVVAVTGFVEAVSEGTTTITAEAGGQTATATVQVVPPPSIVLGSSSVAFETVEGEADPDPATVTVTNGGGGTLSGLTLGTPVDVGGGAAPWVSATLAGAEAPTSIQVSVSGDGLAPGVYEARIPVQALGADNTPRQLAVTLTVLSAPSIELEVDQAQLNAEPGGASDPVEIAITNGGEAALTNLATEVVYPDGGPTGWLTATLAATTAPTTLTLVASSEGLTVGTYEATVVLSAGEAAGPASGPLRQVASVSISVELVVTPGAAIQVSATEVDFETVEGEGSPDPQVVTITNGGGGTLEGLSAGPVSYDGVGGWLVVDLGGTTAPTDLTFTVDASGLGEGTYTASVPVASSEAENSPVVITVTLEVRSTPVIVLSRSRMDFQAVHLGSNPPFQQLQVTNGGGGTLTGLQGFVTYLGAENGWVTGGFSSAQAPSTLTIQPLTGSLPLGTHTASVEVASATDPNVDPVSFTVTFEIVPSFENDIFSFFQTTYSGFSSTPCTNCHFNGGQAPRLDDAVAAYQALVGAGRVVPGNPSASVLICKIKGLSGCGTAMRLPDAQVALIEQWIATGAKY